MLIPRRKTIVFIGTATQQMEELDMNTKENKVTIEERARKEWEQREEAG